MVDEHAVNELRLYTENDSFLWTNRRPNFLANVKRKLQSGKYIQSFPACFGSYFVDEAARRYGKEIDGTAGIPKYFTKQVRQVLAEEFALEAVKELAGK